MNYKHRECGERGIGADEMAGCNDQKKYNTIERQGAGAAWGREREAGPDLRGSFMGNSVGTRSLYNVFERAQTQVIAE